jgi:hypothetical protein
MGRNPYIFGTYKNDYVMPSRRERCHSARLPPRPDAERYVHAADILPPAAARRRRRPTCHWVGVRCDLGVLSALQATGPHM